jgi:cobalt-zinc-cadmium efflux system outer membrane protein
MNQPSTPTPHLVAWCLSAWLLGSFSTHAATDTLTASAALAASSSAVSAAGPHLGVDDLIRQVLRHNPDIRAAQAQTLSAQAGIQSAQAWANPRIDAIQGRNDSRLPGLVPGVVQGWGVSQFIENPRARQFRTEAARASAKDSLHQAQAVRNDLITQVRLRFNEGLLHQAQAQAAAESVTLLEKVRELVRLKVEIGEAPKYEIIKADAEIINARERLQTASLMAQQAQLEINRMAANQLPSGWHLVGDLSAIPDMMSIDQMHALALKHNPTVLSLQTELERLTSELNGAKTQKWPGLEVRYNETLDPEWRQSYLGVGMHIPLLDQRQGPIAQASADLERAQIRLLGRQNELRQQILLAWKSMEIARLRIAALSQGSLREALAALRVSEAAYRFGERGFLDVLDAQRVLRSVRADIIDARYQLQISRVALDQLMGHEAALSPS